VKNTDALHFGILGATRIGPDAVITPAKSHSEVIVAAVASRNSEWPFNMPRPTRFRKFTPGKGVIRVSHPCKILLSETKAPIELIEDPEIDVVYNPVRISHCFAYHLSS
jgi:predicted dehydrogenase